MSTRYIRINPADNVAVAIENLVKGQEVIIDDVSLVLSEDIPAGHKFSLRFLPQGELIIKYGYSIGHALKSIQQGALVDEKNIKTNLSGLLDYTYVPQFAPLEATASDRTFQGYLRANGEVGIRNEIWIIPTVGCVNGIANRLAEMLRQETQSQNIDAIVAYPHNYGCSQLGDDHENTRKILRDMVLHPNAGGVLIVGLGCENNQISAFESILKGQIDSSRIHFMETQKVEDEYEEGMAHLRQIYEIARHDQRQTVSLSKLRVGLKCGGSDGFSGITANPLLGLFSDRLIAQGGTSVLTEVPEMFGAETLLMDRCVSRTVFDKTVQLINDFKAYFIRNEQPIYENPSPGNKAGGISTLEEKSLGCTQKCGKTPVHDVLMYGDRIEVSGLNLLSAPGNDLVASTALAASGCQLVLFTTGRGTPFGTFVPTMKIATNSTLANRKPLWIDFNAGTILEGKEIEEVCSSFLEYVIRVASGEDVNNEKSGFREIAIFKTGVTL